MKESSPSAHGSKKLNQTVDREIEWEKRNEFEAQQRNESHSLALERKFIYI